MLEHLLSVNEFTTPQWTFDQDVQVYARMGVTNIGIMRRKLEAYGYKQGNHLLQDNNMNVSSLCIAGFFVAANANDRQQGIDDTLFAIDIAAHISAQTLIIISGPALNMPRDIAMEYFREGIAKILPAARSAGVHLSVEPLHPMYAAEASFLCTLQDSLDAVSPFSHSDVGIVVDTFHLWWQANLLSELRLAGPRISAVHVSDWRQNTRSFCDRAIPGQGVIQWNEILEAIMDAGYQGVYEIEILSDELWQSPPDKLLQKSIAAYQTTIAPQLAELKRKRCN